MKTPFEMALESYQRVLERRRALMGKTEERFTLRRENLFKKVFPRKKKFDYKLFVASPEGKTFNDNVKKLAHRFYECWNRREKKVLDELTQLADTTEVPRDETFRLFYSVSSFNYSTQGFGAMHYAKGDAENRADIARSAGLEAEIRCTNQDQYHHADYEVWVKTTDLGIFILKFKSSLSLKERVRLCWKRGCNPRVMMPFLPVRYEEKNGLDFFGGYLKTV